MSFPDTPTHVHHAFSAPPVPPPGRRKTGLVIGAAAAVIALMAGTGVGVWLLTRPAATAAPGPAGTFVIDGLVRLTEGFTWQSQTDQRCWGIGGYADIAGGAQVTVMDAGGRKLAVGKLDTGGAEGIKTDGRASSCVLKFKITGVPAGVGPYGVEVSQRGVNSYTETELTKTVLTLGFS